MMQQYSEIKQKLVNYFKSGKNVLLEGRHGTGKTSMITEIFTENCGKWLYFSGATLDPWVDFIGIPKEVKKDNNYVLSFVLPEQMADDKVEAIFIDEYNRSHKKVKNATMELIQFKSINGRKFPNLKVVWAAINPNDEDSDDYDVEELDPAQQDRFQIQIKMPDSPDSEYFDKKYGKDHSKSAVEWWNGLPKDFKKLVSPRRLDYALEVYNEGGDVFDVLPSKTNPTKLLATLKNGSLEDKLKDMFKKHSSKEVAKFFEQENNYHGSLPIIKRNDDYMKFFLPILDEERISSLYFQDSEFKNFILKHAVYFKNALQEISKFKGIDVLEVKTINRALKQLGDITVF
jgi:DNA polymerase III delta prime subunit